MKPRLGRPFSFFSAAAAATTATAPLRSQSLLLLLRNSFTTATPTRVLPPASRRLATFQRSPLALARRLRPLRSARSKSDKATPSPPPRQQAQHSQHPQQPHVNPTPHLGSPEPALSLSQRLKQLSREYGWTAVGVYLALSALDFPFCFLAVRLLGTERIGHYEDVVKHALWTVVRVFVPSAGSPSQQQHEEAAAADVDAATAREEGTTASDAAMRSDASIWTQLGIAYLVHKSFIFVRVPLTAAVLPKVVKTLRKWGYNIGKKKPKTP